MAILVVFLFDLRSFAGFLTVHIPVWAGLARAARRSLACRRRPCKSRKPPNGYFFILQGDFE